MSLTSDLGDCGRLSGIIVDNQVAMGELMIRIREAVEVCLEAQGDSLEPLDFVGVQTISVAS